MNTSVDLKKIFELIDLYKYASVKGERVEIIVTPFEVDGKWDDSKRKITIGLQGGYSRDRDTFVVENAREFDEVILPQILAYYSNDDALGKWDITVPTMKEATIKGVSETTAGNLFYLETFNESLFETALEEKEKVEEKTTYAKSEVTDEDKVWEEIIRYANSRRMVQDFYNGASFTDDERNNIYDFIVNASKDKSVSIASNQKSIVKNENLLKELFDDKAKAKTMGLDSELIARIVNTSATRKLAKLVGSEKRIRRRVDIEDPVVQAKIDFAVSELDKVSYFDLKNANAKQFDGDEFTSSQPGAVVDLKRIYDNPELYDEKKRNEYKGYCDELLSFLNHKAKDKKKIVKTEAKTPSVLFEEYDDAVVDSYEKLDEAIELVLEGKLDNEHYEMIVESDAKDSTKRRVRISLLDGVSRNDTFNFLFTDGEKFDEEFRKRFDKIRENDPRLISSINYINVPGVEGFVKDVIHRTQQDNEIVIRNATDDMAFLRQARIVEENTKPEEPKDNIDPVPNVNPLVRLEQQILDYAREADKALEAKNTEAAEEAKKAESAIERLKRLEAQINDMAREQDMAYDTTVSFEQMHEYVMKYKITNSNGPLQIFDRETGKEFIPSTEEEKRNIEFAIYWATGAGIIPNVNDVVYGEKNAFSDEYKKLYDLMDVQFKESIRRGIDVDFDSLKEQFQSSGVKFSREIYDQLFENNYYKLYVIDYYKKSLGKDHSKDQGLRDLADTVKGARATARQINDEIQHNKLVVAAQEYAKSIQAMNERAKLVDGAQVQARLLNGKDEYQRILASSKVEAERINTNNQLIEGAADQAKRLIDKDWNAISEHSALDEALRMNDEELHDIAVTGAPAQAMEIINNIEKQNAVAGAVDQALLLRNEAERQEVIEGAPEQAAQLVGVDAKAPEEQPEPETKDEEEAPLFEIVPSEQEEEHDEELVEIQDAFEVAESYASVDQPTSIKVFFDKNDPENKGEVIITSGFGVKEEVVCQKSFDKEKLTNKVLPLLCKLYAKDNEVSINRMFDIGNTGLAGLLVVGTNERVFQITNAETSYISACSDLLNSELYKNKPEEGMSK